MDSIKHSNNGKSAKVHKEKTILDLFRIIYKRKWIIIGTVVATLILAYVYNELVTPIYEATVLLKKETAPDKGLSTEFTDILSIQTQDEIETEMELVETWSVMSKVVEDLNLFLNVKQIVEPNGTVHEIKQPIIEYSDSSYLYDSSHPFSYPEFLSVELKNKKESMVFVVKKTGEDRLEIYDEEGVFLGAATDETAENFKLTTDTIDLDSEMELENLIVKTGSVNSKVFEISDADIELYWPDAPVGAEVHFSVDTYYKALEKFKKKISVTRKGKTNVFNVSVRSSSPQAAMIMANTLIDKFRESRILQQKETIRYSFNFVDEQLTEMQEKLREAEDNLSGFKASGQIMTINESSRELVQFLSKLEAEKMATDLQLDDYKNKIADLESELESSGYFDQSFLSPENPESNSPFSTLMKKLSELELQRLELLQKRTENHPDVISIDQQIRMTKEKLGTFNENTLTAYQIIINSLEKKLLKISNLMSKYEVKMERLPSQENRLARLMRQKNVYEKIFTLLLDKREEMRMAELSKLQDIAIVDDAHEPTKPVSPRKMFNMLVAFMIGGFIGVVGIFLLELRENKLINLDEIEEEFQIPIFAIIPEYNDEIKDKIENAKEPSGKFVTMMGEEFGFRESFRLLRTKILFQMKNDEKIFLITSCEENTGKTSIVANLSVSIAEEGRKVLVIDCDLRKAELSKMFDVPKSSDGLIQFLTKNSVAPTILTKISPNIDILPAGGTREDSANLLNSERMKILFEAIDTSNYDYILIDTPPVTRVVDTLVLGRWINDALLIVRPNYSFKESVTGGINDMKQAYIKIHGIISNASKIEASSYRYRYGYGYGYSYGSKPANWKQNFKQKKRKFSKNRPVKEEV